MHEGNLLSPRGHTSQERTRLWGTESEGEKIEIKKKREPSRIGRLFSREMEIAKDTKIRMGGKKKKKKNRWAENHGPRERGTR